MPKERAQLRLLAGDLQRINALLRKCDNVLGDVVRAWRIERLAAGGAKKWADAGFKREARWLARLERLERKALADLREMEKRGRRR